MGELTSFLSNREYNKLLRDRHARFVPVDAKTFYTVSCGRKGVIKEDTEPTGIIFTDGTYLRVHETWSAENDDLLWYSYHYQIPHDLSIRYDKDSQSAAVDHPEHHIQTSKLGKNIRLPTGEVRCEEVLKLIFEQFVKPNLSNAT